MKEIILTQKDVKNTLLGISYDTIFTVLTTILIFILGYVIAKRIESRKERKRLLELEKYFLKNLEMLEKPVELQIKSLINTSKRLKNKREESLIVDDIIGLSGSFLNDTDNKDLYKIFVNNKKGDIQVKTELYRKLRASLDYIIAVKKGFLRDSLAYMKKSEGFSNKYKRNIKIVNDLLDDLIYERIKEKSHPENFPALYKIARIRTTWMDSSQTEDKLDLFYSFTNFIKPVQEICKISQNDEIVGQIIKPVMECVYEYHNIVELRYFYRKHFVAEARELQRNHFEIKEVLKGFATM
ncbi:MAG TPA: hypothetical protein PKA77_04415 [Chitinophagaceae bacterium]|nr:hypothetical protein [Chitinophagaceae bacterium]HMU59251.1 hypothetical protein [Chitinophagaceae bacterium]